MKRTKTKNALVASMLAMLLCIAMLVGSTFAWFTDTASTGVNKIQAGSLKVGIEMATAWDSNGVPTQWEDATGQTLAFIKAAGAPAGEAVLWEPGCTYRLPEFRIVNRGDLALEYKVIITGIAGDAKLNEVIEWKFEQYVSDTDPITGNPVYEANAGGNLTGGNTISGIIEPDAANVAATDPYVITGTMAQNAGNEYQGLSIDGISITVVAKQHTFEQDSFNDQYDLNATYETSAPQSITLTQEDLNELDAQTGYAPSIRRIFSAAGLDCAADIYKGSFTSADAFNLTFETAQSETDCDYLVTMSDGSKVAVNFILEGQTGSLPQLYIKDATDISQVKGDYAIIGTGSGTTIPEAEGTFLLVYLY